MDNMELKHHGILGMKWGVRRFQNKDGTLTSSGRSRYLTKEQKKYDRTINKTKNVVSIYNAVASRMNNGELEKFNTSFDKKYGEDWIKKYGTNSKQYDEYVKEYQSLNGRIFAEEIIKKFGERPV